LVSVLPHSAHYHLGIFRFSLVLAAQFLALLGKFLPHDTL